MSGAPCMHPLPPLASCTLHVHLLARTLHHEHTRCVRCGVAFAGHPAEEEQGGHLLTLHGRIGNIPASEVEVVVDAEAPHRIQPCPYPYPYPYTYPYPYPYPYP